jgi:hypothetical protein
MGIARTGDRPERLATLYEALGFENRRELRRVGS